MVCYGIERLRQAGITDILIVISKQSAGLYADFLGSGENFGVNLTYRVQESAGGSPKPWSWLTGLFRPAASSLYC